MVTTKARLRGITKVLLKDIPKVLLKDTTKVHRKATIRVSMVGSTNTHRNRLVRSQMHFGQDYIRDRTSRVDISRVQVMAKDKATVAHLRNINSNSMEISPATVIISAGSRNTLRTNTGTVKKGMAGNKAEVIPDRAGKGNMDKVEREIVALEPL